MELRCRLRTCLDEILKLKRVSEGEDTDQCKDPRIIEGLKGASDRRTQIVYGI